MEEHKDTAGRSSGMGENSLESTSYTTSDVRNVFEACHPNNWNDVVKFIDHNRGRMHDVTPGNTDDMRNDFQKLDRDGKPFKSDPKEAFQDAHPRGSVDIGRRTP